MGRTTSGSSEGESTRLVVPEALAQACDAYGHPGFIDELDGLVGAAARLWGLEVGPPFLPGGRSAWVAPVRRAGGSEAVLKVTWPHPEAAQEIEALRFWQGEGAVLAYEESRLEGGWLALIERCRPGLELRERPEEEQDVVLTGLLRRLWRVPGDGWSFRPLAEMCEEWASQYETRPAGSRAVLDPAIAAEGISLMRELPRQQGNEVLLCTDLHAGNVLAAKRQPWLVIDPKPHLGDPAYDVVQHLLNCTARMAREPEATISRLSDLAGLDRERVHLWTFARAVEASPYWPGMAELARRLAP